MLAGVFLKEPLAFGVTLFAVDHEETVLSGSYRPITRKKGAIVSQTSTAPC